jgi:hypothetical protein
MWGYYGIKIERNWSSGPEKEEGLPSKEIPTRNILAGNWKPQYTIQGPSGDQQTYLDLSQRKGQTCGEKPA